MFSLVTGIADGIHNLRNLIKSLIHQENLDWELIVVDQSDNKSVEELCKEYSNYKIILVRTSIRGISRARNIGLMQISGSYVAFPDVDCRYPTDLLAKIKSYFDRYSDRSALVVNIGSSEEGPFDDYLGKRINSQGKIASKWHLIKSSSLFLRRDVVMKIGEFDENFGINAPFGSSEDSDYVFRIIKNNYDIYYDRELYVIHPLGFTSKDMNKKAFNYGMGRGALIKKYLVCQRQYQLIPYAISLVTVPLIGLIFGFGEIRVLNWYFLKGRIKGFFSYNKNP